MCFCLYRLDRLETMMVLQEPHDVRRCLLDNEYLVPTRDALALTSTRSFERLHCTITAVYFVYSHSNSLTKII